MRIQYKCLVPIYVFPEMKPCVQPRYFQNRIKKKKMFCLPIPTLIFLWEIDIFPGSVCLFVCSQICGPILGIFKFLTDSQTHEWWRNWDWDRAIHFLGIHKLDFRYSVAITIGNIAWNLLSAKNECVTSAYQNITSCSLRNMFIVYVSITWRTWLYPALQEDRVLLFPDTPRRNF